MRHIREKQRLSSRGKLATYSWHPSSFGPFWSHPPPQPPRPRHRPLLFGSLQALTDRAKEWHGRGETANRGMVRRLESNFHLKNAPETLPWMMDSYIQNPRRNFFSDKKKWESNYFLREGYRNPWFLPIYLFQMMLGGGVGSDIYLYIVSEYVWQLPSKWARCSIATLDLWRATGHYCGLGGVAG